ncbi:MAG: T9SS type A sorting domain-containing protein [Prolixibacteraceae bacterium]|nr:T9SS type A sorting domain-containing protein [Prolixibacteraceae bacterium]
MRKFLQFLLLWTVIPGFTQTIIDENATGGSTYIFDFRSDVLYVPKGPTIEFYDTSGDNFELINSVYPIKCNDLLDMIISGNSLFVIGDMSQVVVYDISDPANPVITNQGQMPGGVYPHWAKNILALSGEILYIATEDGIYKSDLNNAGLVFEKCVDEDVYAIAISGNWIYGITNLFGTYSLKSWNLTDPGYAVQYNQVVDNNDLDIFDDVLFTIKGSSSINEEGMTIYQVDGAGGLTHISQIGVNESFINSVNYDQGTDRLVVGSVEDNSRHYVSVYDVADLQNPVQEVPQYETLRNNCVRYHNGSVYYSCLSEDAYLTKLDLDAGGLTETTFLTSPYKIDATCRVDNQFFVGSESLLYLFRLGESNKPELVKTFNNEDYPWGDNIKALAGFGGRLYVMDGTEVVTLCDIDGDELISRGSFNAGLKSVNYLAGNENVLASIEFSFTDQQVKFFDCSDADNPIEALTWDWWCRDWVITPNEAYMIFSSQETNDVFFYNITDPASVHQAGNFAVVGTQATLAVSDSILVVASITSTDPFVSTIEVYSIIDVSAPVLLAQTNIDGQVFDMQVENDYILVALGEGGWKILEMNRTEVPGSNLKSAQFFFTIEDVMNYYLTAYACNAIPFFFGSMGNYFFALLQNVFGELFTDYFGMPSFVVQLPRQPAVSYELEIAISPPEAKENGCSVSPDVGKYNHTMGYVASLTATDNPSAGWYFKEWQGAAGGSEKSTSVMMDADKKVTAVFARKYNLTVNISPAAAAGGCTVTPAGTTQHDEGEVVEIDVTAGEGWSFVAWSGDVLTAQTTITVTMNDNKTVTANFIRNYNLTVDISPAEAASTCTVSPLGIRQYVEGEEVEIGAAAGDGWRFDKWTGASSSTVGTTTIKMDGNKIVTANFKRVYDLTVNISPQVAAEACSVNPLGTTEYDEGAEVEINASVGDGWNFLNWTGDISSQELKVTVTMTKDIYVTANFSFLYNLYMSLEPQGAVEAGCTVSQSGSGSYSGGETVTLTALPGEGWNFVRWEGDVAYSENPYTFTIYGDEELTCIFEQISGIEQVNHFENKYRIYPNPATDQLIFEFGKIAGLDVELEIVSMSGQKLLEKQISLFAGQKETIDVSRLQNGIYLLKILDSKDVFSQTIVIR